MKSPAGNRIKSDMVTGEGSPKEEAGGMPTRPSSPFLLYSTPTGVQIQSQHSAEAGNARRNKARVAQTQNSRKKRVEHNTTSKETADLQQRSRACDEKRRMP